MELGLTTGTDPFVASKDLVAGFIAADKEWQGEVILVTSKGSQGPKRPTVHQESLRVPKHRPC